MHRCRQETVDEKSSASGGRTELSNHPPQGVRHDATACVRNVQVPSCHFHQARFGRSNRIVVCPVARRAGACLRVRRLRRAPWEATNPSVPMPPGQRFQTASMSKMITGWGMVLAVSDWNCVLDTAQAVYSGFKNQLPAFPPTPPARASSFQRALSREFCRIQHSQRGPNPRLTIRRRETAAE